MTTNLLQSKGFFWSVLFILMFLVIFLINDVLSPFVFALIISYICNPFVDFLQKFLKSRSLVSFLITFVSFTLFLMIFIFVIPSFVSKVVGFINELSLNKSSIQSFFLEKMYNLIDSDYIDIQKNIHDHVGKILDLTANTFSIIVGDIFKSALAIVNIVSFLLLSPIITFYFLRDWQLILKKIEDFIPLKHKEIIKEQINLVHTSLLGCLRGQFNLCILLSICYSLAFVLMQLKSAIILGFILGFMSFIPYLGFIIGGTLILTLSYIQNYDIYYVGYILSIIIFGQVCENIFLIPKLIGEKIGIHSAWVLFYMVVFGYLFGFIGILFAIPMASVISVVTRFLLKQYFQSNYYKS